MMETENVDRHLARRLEHFCPETLTDAGVWLFSLGRSSVIVSAVVSLLIAGCGSTPKKNPPESTGKSGGYYLDDGPGPNPPNDLDSIPDAVPRNEPIHRSANKPYAVFGKTYVPNVSTDRFRQKGIASWYGRKYHGKKTASGEIYNMYAMTAAHPTLPLPCYVRVTNTANGKSVVVRINDRGPFLSDRLIDVSYAAANRLDILRRGSGQVVVERVFPGDKSLTAEPQPSMAVSMPIAPSISPPDETVASLPAATPLLPANAIAASPITGNGSALFLQLGAFSSRENAEIFRTRMQSELDWNREPILLLQSGNLFQVRLGPYKSRDEAQAIGEQVKASLNFSPIISRL